MKTQPLDVALTAALFGTWTGTAQNRVDAFKKAIGREGFMIVPQDFGKEALEPDKFYDPENDDEYESVYDMAQEIGGHAPVKVGRRITLPPVYAVRIPVDDGGYEIEQYDTLAEAEAMCKEIYG